MTKRSVGSKPVGKRGNGRSAYRFRSPEAVASDLEKQVFLIRKGVICDTDVRGHKKPDTRSLTEIVVDASEGFIPLWEQNTTLRWRFQEHSLLVFEDPDAAAEAIRDLLGRAVLAWGDAAPVRFTQRNDAWDFELVVRATDRCSINGCVLASAFFPDAGRHELRIYPKMFEQTDAEQVETLVHEIGHAFGLRHFFAKLSEEGFPSEIFGTHDRFSIMNYGADSVLTENDRSDLKNLYESAWSGDLTDINGTPIRLVKPFSATAGDPESMVATRRARRR